MPTGRAAKGLRAEPIGGRQLVSRGDADKYGKHFTAGRMTAEPMKHSSSNFFLTIC